MLWEGKMSNNDPMAERFDAKQKQHKLEELARKALTPEQREAEEKLLKETKKVDPIKGAGEAGRNDPCPCGSGKKYKKCCGKAK
jgi:uncharacterized protein YecA (UPF0149 family)